MRCVHSVQMGGGGGGAGSLRSSVLVSPLKVQTLECETIMGASSGPGKFRCSQEAGPHAANVRFPTSLTTLRHTRIREGGPEGEDTCPEEQLTAQQHFQEKESRF